MQIMLRRLALLALVVLALAGCARSGMVHSFVLVADPNNTVALPENIRLQAGDTLRIQNNDSVPRQIGTIIIAPGDSFSQQFRGPGTFEYSCTAHASGRLHITVDP